jgi:predicted amidohydrolase YtcJ
VTNATIYTVDEAFDTATAMAISGGKISYSSDDEIKDLMSRKTHRGKRQFIYPGLIDAHCHFYGFGLSLQEVDLRGTKSMEDVVKRIQAFQLEKIKLYCWMGPK